MAEKPAEPKQTDPKSFASFLNEEPPAPETVTMAGYVSRSARSGSFVLNCGGQNLELPVDAVQSYKVLCEAPQKLVEIQVLAGKIDTSRIMKPIVADSGVPKPVFADHHKWITTDPLVDKPHHTDPLVDVYTTPQGGIPDPTAAAAAGAQPFILATPHHASPEALATQMAGIPAAQLSTVQTDIATTIQADVHTSIYLDTQTSVYADTHTSVYADQTSVYADAGNTSVYLDPHTSVYLDQKTSVYLDNPHTVKEVALDPIQQPQFDPQVAQAAAMRMEPAAAATGAGSALTSVYADMQTSVYADAQTSVYADAQTSVYADQQTSVYADQQTSVYADSPGTPPFVDYTSVYADQPHTIKELIKDPIRDQIVAGPVWNLPGMMF
jgi:hypothetical protein